MKAKSKELLGYEITVKELRLIPYLHYIVINEQIIDTRKINNEEMELIRAFENKGYCDFSINRFTVTKQFYDAMSEIIYLAYVEITK